jgi:amyloid beta precursor protein binding protein 1
LLRATAVGTETAKNLVLPGVGEILVVDDVAQVTTEYASNFFLVNDSSNNSKSRAEMADTSANSIPTCNVPINMSIA